MSSIYRFLGKHNNEHYKAFVYYVTVAKFYFMKRSFILAVKEQVIGGVSLRQIYIHPCFKTFNHKLQKAAMHGYQKKDEPKMKITGREY